MSEKPAGSGGPAAPAVPDLDGLRVALVLGTAAGGVGRHVRSVAERLAARGARVLVCGPAETERLFGFTEGGVRFEEVDLADRPRPVRDARAVARLRRLLRGADVVHAHGLRAGALPWRRPGRPSRPRWRWPRRSPTAGGRGGCAAR